jgi:acyl-CoA synthetase (AMP-forming)/AMP-acid ligase II
VSQLLVGDVLKSSAGRLPHGVCASLEGELITYAEMERRTADLADALCAVGIGRGDRVVWQAETCLEVIPLYFATARLGAMFVPINPRYTADEAKRVIAHADPKMILGDKASGHERIESLLARRLTGTGSREAPQENDGHVIFYTSGTTGEPKGCVLSQRTQRLRAGNKAPFPQGGELCMFPQFHMSGWTRVLEHWVEGNEISYVRRPDADELLHVMHTRRPRSTYCIPAVWQRIFDADKSRYDLSSLKVVDTGTSLVTTTLLDALADLFPGSTTAISYGSTEGGLVCVCGPEEGPRRATTVGRATPGVMLEIDETGELIVDSHCLFSGYFRNEAATRKALRDGKYHTGDLAERDDRGLYRIVGRATDLIRTGSEAVAPSEVEAVLVTCPGIAEIGIVGVPDPTWGEVVTAFVVVRPGHEVTLEQLRAHGEKRLAKYKIPRRMHLIDKLPRTAATGQIQRRLLLAAPP